MPRLVHRHRWEWRLSTILAGPGDTATCMCGARIQYQPRIVDGPVHYHFNRILMDYVPVTQPHWAFWRLLTRGARVIRELGADYLDTRGRPWTALLLAQVPVEQLGRVIGEGVYLRG